MCGVFGVVGSKAASQTIYDGLRRLEYRGYDSAGIAIINDNAIALIKSEGKLSQLQPMLATLPASAGTGMGHTRWATHGAPTTANAHPHIQDGVALIHNGIIENYVELKEELKRDGAIFKSDTDSEVALHLLIRELKRSKDVKSAILAVVNRLEGAYGLGIMLTKEPDALYFVKQGSPVVLGIGNGENYFASDAMSLLPHTNKALFLNDGEIGRITRTGYEIWDFKGQVHQRPPTHIEGTPESAGKQGYRHFMLKEIHEQPGVMSQLIKRFVDRTGGTFNQTEMGLDKIDKARVNNITLVACGTAYHAAALAKYFFENYAGLPVNVELASEYRYRRPYINRHTLFVSVSQSGETADTLACVKFAKEAGAQLLSICNVKHSSIPRASDAVLYMEAGPEICVASTKAFTAMVMSLHLFSLGFGQKRGTLTPAQITKAIEHLTKFPLLVDQAVNTSAHVEELATAYYEAKNFIYMGRGTSWTTALEGALKLKEISYIHAEGYAGGELKHGPIALVDRHMPIVAVVPQDGHHDKMLSNVEEVRAREGRLIGVGADKDKRLRDLCSHYIAAPQIDEPALQVILDSIPLQLLAYYIAIKRGTDVDQPRNLAKSVTVE